MTVWWRVGGKHMGIWARKTAKEGQVCVEKKTGHNNMERSNTGLNPRTQVEKNNQTGSQHKTLKKKLLQNNDLKVAAEPLKSNDSCNTDTLVLLNEQWRTNP